MAQVVPMQNERGRRRDLERGEGHLKLLVVIIIFGLIGYSCFMIVPPYVNNYQLQDTCQSESALFAAHQKTDQKVKDTVWAEVQSLGIPIKQEDIKVQVVGRTALISVDYTITVSLFGFELNLDFHPKGESPIV
ncbi:MAG TPA: hypothetical protein VMV61_12160 [Patescibacteria group bacterium]|nr:hypothetical protein [Patescibacteria group bacterium]